MTEAAVRLAAGVAAMGEILARTYGPGAAPVLVGDHGKPELITEAAVLARRLTALGDPKLHPGAMALREACLGVRRRCGDGAATVAVLARELVASATRLVVAGADPGRLRRGIDRGVDVCCAALASASELVAGRAALAGLAFGAGQDHEVAEVIAEVCEALGDRVALVLEERAGPGLEAAFVDGARWRAAQSVPDLVALPAGEAVTLHDPLVILADETVREAAEVVPALELGLVARRSVLLITRGLEGAARAAVLANRHRLSVVPARLTELGEQLPAHLGDLALLTGATPLGDLVGRPLRSVREADCGTARRAQLTRAHLTLTRGGGDPATIRATADRLAAHTTTVDPGGDAWSVLRQRRARLSGSQAVIIVGGVTECDRTARIEAVRSSQRVVELALAGGVVAGGGTALRDAAGAVRAARGSCDSDEEAWGLSAIADALSAPARRIGPSGGAVILDPVGVLIGAVRAAGSLAGSVITTAAVLPYRRAS
ncbi:TCP-1/cpn60 chaperonin family protein [Microlunatus sp. GCM10028923]|uniref:TCP-1/cpn60 chaperonin family protein n=1 Tax=Microlunatus sp. GCM10028923 TaxID=3273400 RepID=UPI003613C4A6